MTKPQAEALAQVRRIMNANFDSWIIAHKIVDEGLRCAISCDWHGDISDVIGLNELTKRRLMQFTDGGSNSEAVLR